MQCSRTLAMLKKVRKIILDLSLCPDLQLKLMGSVLRRDQSFVQPSLVESC